MRSLKRCGSYAMVFRSLGSVHSLTVTGPNASASAYVSASDCTVTAVGYPAFVAVDGSGSASGLEVVDNNWEKVEVVGQITGSSVITSSADEMALDSWEDQQTGEDWDGSCDPTDCPGADPPCNGPCTKVCKSVAEELSVLSSDYPGSTTLPANLPDWYPPVDVGECDQPGTCSPSKCEECPSPWAAYSWAFSGDTGFVSTSIWVGGLTNVFFNPEFCA